MANGAAELDLSDINLVSTANAEALAMHTKVSAAKKKEKEKDAIKTATGKGKAPAKEKAEKPAPKLRKADLKAVQEMSQAGPGEKDEKLEKERAANLVKINLYVKFLPQEVPAPPGGKSGEPWPAHTPAEDAKACLEQIRANLSLRNLIPTSRTYMITLLGFYESAVMKSGFNPRGWDIEGLASLIEQHPEMLESEMTEIAIEQNRFFNSNCYLRFLMKLLAVSEAYSQNKQGLHRASVEKPSEVLQQDYKDL